MTYCVGIRLKDGMIFASDTRTNAGVDQVSMFRKMYQYGIEGERFLVLQTAGNLATSQAVFTKLDNAIKLAQERNLHTVPTLYDAAQLVGECLRETTIHAQTIAQETDTKFRSSFILGGQIKGQSPEIYFIYPEGNCIRATTDTPFFQLGESKYGKPILDRSMNYNASLKSAMRAILISFDSTIRSNLSVGMPIDVLVYHNDSLQMPQGYRIDENDEYFANIRQHWSDGLRKILNELEDSPMSYWQ
ncbi:peptidase [Moraxella osloensis]|nr:peptidase [Moraxella osloensis]MDK1670739.1 peptidase [Moraxella osloensis]